MFKANIRILDYTPLLPGKLTFAKINYHLNCLYSALNTFDKGQPAFLI